MKDNDIWTIQASNTGNNTQKTKKNLLDEKTRNTEKTIQNTSKSIIKKPQNNPEYFQQYDGKKKKQIKCECGKIITRGSISRHCKTQKHQNHLNNNIENVSSIQEKTDKHKLEEQMNKPEGKPSGQRIFKHYDTRYMAWLKKQLDKRETMDKLVSLRNDIIEANKSVNYWNQIERMENEIHRDNLNHNSLKHLQYQIIQFKNLKFT